MFMHRMRMGCPFAKQSSHYRHYVNEHQPYFSWQGPCVWEEDPKEHMVGCLQQQSVEVLPLPTHWAPVGRPDLGLITAGAAHPAAWISADILLLLLLLLTLVNTDCTTNLTYMMT